MKIFAIDTTPRKDLASLKASEAAVFDVLEEHAKGYGIAGFRQEQADRGHH